MSSEPNPGREMAGEFLDYFGRASLPDNSTPDGLSIAEILLMDSVSSAEAMMSNASITEGDKLAVSTIDAEARERVEVLLLGLVFVIGAPLNFFAMRSLLRDYRHLSRHPRQRDRLPFLLLKINITVSDILILLCYVPPKVGWLLTFEWRGGVVGCKIFKFLSTLAFHHSSYAIVAVAHARFLTVLRSARPQRHRKSSVQCMILLCWIVAGLCSAPQLFIWTVLDEPTLNILQCTTIFSIKVLRFSYESVWETVYDISGLLSVFWLPALYITAVYAYMASKLRSLAFKDPVPYGASSGIAPDFSSANQSHAKLSRIDTPVSYAGAGAASSSKRSARRILLTSRAKNKTAAGPAAPCFTPDERSVASCAPRISLDNDSGVEEASSPGPSSSSALPGQQSKTHLVVTLEGVSGRSTPDSSYVPAFQQSVRGSWRNNFKSRRRVFSQTGLIVVVYFVCWLPYFGASLLPYNFKVFNTLIALCAAVNPIIYLFD